MEVHMTAAAAVDMLRVIVVSENELVLMLADVVVVVVVVVEHVANKDLDMLEQHQTNTEARAVVPSSLGRRTSYPRGLEIVRSPWANLTLAEKDKEPRTARS